MMMMQPVETSSNLDTCYFLSSQVSEYLDMLYNPQNWYIHLKSPNDRHDSTYPDLYSLAPLGPDALLRINRSTNINANFSLSPFCLFTRWFFYLFQQTATHDSTPGHKQVQHFSIPTEKGRE